MLLVLGAIKVNEKEGNETKLDVIDDQMSSYTDSSDDSSVISESEGMSLKSIGKFVTTWLALIVYCESCALL